MGMMNTTYLPNL